MDPTLARTSEGKTALRTRLIAWRAGLTNEQRVIAERAMCRHVLALIDQQPVRAVAAYWAIRHEPLLHHAWTELRKRGVKLALPVVAQRDAPMEFRRWRGEVPTSTDACGIVAPLDGRVMTEVDVIVVPCVGYHARGFRLGYGGGYFDRTLATFARKPYTIGVAFSQQLCQFDPEPHDVALDAVVTEHGGLMINEMAPITR